jgi:hypothetical protein
MPIRKASGPKGVLIEFYKVYWDMIKHDYLAMVLEAIRLNKFPPGIY